jgi:hypothetical protein
MLIKQTATGMVEFIDLSSQKVMLVLSPNTSLVPLDNGVKMLNNGQFYTYSTVVFSQTQTKTQTTPQNFTGTTQELVQLLSASFFGLTEDSGGGGGSGAATASKQTTQIDKAEVANQKIELLAKENTAQSTNTKLDLLATETTQQEISNKTGASLPNALIGTDLGFSVTTNGQAASPIIVLTSAASRFKTLSVTIIGVPSFSGTINLQMRLTTSAAWTTVNNGIVNTQTGVRVSSGFTAAGTYTINLPVAAEVRLASTAWASGQANVTIVGSYKFFTNEISNVNTQAISGSVSLSGTPNVNISQLNASATATGSTTYRGIFASGAAVQVVIKNSRANLYGLQIFNGSANAAYIRLYNSATVVATGAATVPIKTLCLTPSANTIIPFANFGSLFPTGLAFNVINGFADTDATPTTGAIIVNADYA